MSSGRTLTIALFHDQSGWTLEDRFVERLRAAAGPGVEIRRATSSTQFAEMLPGTTHLLGLPASEDQIVAAAPPAGSLRWVQLAQSIGDATPATSAALRAGIEVCAADTVRAPAIAEHTLALLGAITRRIGASISAQSEHRWASAELARSARLISSMTIGVVAVGAVARSVIAILRGLGATAQWAEPSAAHPFLGPGDAHPDGGGAPLADVLTHCDAVIVACPRIPSTVGLLGKAELARIKRGAIVIDVSGGGVVSETALLDALRRDRVSAAAIDGFEREPLAVGSPWWTMPNVIVTPRLSGASAHYWDRATDWFADNIRRAMRDEPRLDRLPAAWVEDAATARR
jgi:phosphoglycerate dehydrogenase-like enzyme